MMTVIEWVVGILVFLSALTFSVAIHEAGHMAVGKLFKLSVPRYFIGFGPTVFSRKHGSTEYGIKGLPLGGFVEIEDESIVGTDNRSVYERKMLSHVSPWKRILICLTGPTVNIIVGYIMLVITLMSFAMPTVTNQIQAVNNCATAAKINGSCTAEKAGLIVGDTIKNIDGKTITNYTQLSKALTGRETAQITVDRNGKNVTVNSSLHNGKLGITLATKNEKMGLGESVSAVNDAVQANVNALLKLPTLVPNVVESTFGHATRAADAPSSVVVVGKVYGETAASPSPSMVKLRVYLIYTALLNLALGLGNLLPIMPLDGGRAFLAVLDGVKGIWAKVRRTVYEPVSERMVSIISVTMGGFIFTLMGLLIVSDIIQVVRSAV